MPRGLTLGEADWIAQRFHNTAESLAPNHVYETRYWPPKPWNEMPEKSKALMTDVISHLFEVDDQNRLVLTEPQRNENSNV